MDPCPRELLHPNRVGYQAMDAFMVPVAGSTHQ